VSGGAGRDHAPDTVVDDVEDERVGLLEHGDPDAGRSGVP
jgi:hypothetical protein